MLDNLNEHLKGKRVTLWLKHADGGKYSIPCCEVTFISGGWLEYKYGSDTILVPQSEIISIVREN